MRLLLTALLLPTAAAFHLPHVQLAGANSRTRRVHCDPAMVDSAEIEALQRQIQILELQAQLRALEQQAAVASSVDAPTVPAAAVVPAVPALSAPVEAVPVPMPVPVPAMPAPVPAMPAPVPAVPAPVPDILMNPSAAVGSGVFGEGAARCFGDECTKSVVSSDVSAEIAQGLAQGLGFFALLPVGYFGVTKFVEFVNERYDAINGEVGGGDGAQPPASDAGPSPYPWRK